MGFWSVCSRSGAIRDELLEIQSDLFKDGSHATNRCRGGKQPASHLAFDLVEGQGAVDLVGRVGVEAGVGSDVSGQGMEVVANGLGPEILASGVPGQTGGMFQAEAVLDPLESLLDTPAAVIELRESLSGKRNGIEQRGHHHMNLASRGYQAHQSNRCRGCGTLIVGGILPGRRSQGHHLLVQARANEITHHHEACGDITTDTEIDAAHRQRGHQPTAGKAAIKHQQVVLTQRVERLEKHLALVAAGFVQHEVQKQLDPGKVKAEGDALDYRPNVILEDRQSNGGAIGGDDAHAAPERNGQMLFGQCNQLPIDVAENQRTDLVTRLGECLRRDFPHRIGTVLEVGEELIKLGLDRTLQTGQ